MTEPLADARLESFLAASRDLALAVHRGEVSRDAAAKAVAGFIVAAGIPPAFVWRDVQETLKVWRNPS